jgi:hypothetical protein
MTLLNFLERPDKIIDGIMKGVYQVGVIELNAWFFRRSSACSAVQQPFLGIMILMIWKILILRDLSQTSRIRKPRRSA